MGKSWMKANITTKTFKDRVKSFIDFARVGAIRGEISCPCNKCGHDEWFLVDVVHQHILQHDDIRGLVQDALGVNSLNSKSEEYSESRLEGDIRDIEVDIEEEDIMKESEEEDIVEESEEVSKEDIGERPRVAANSQQRNPDGKLRHPADGLAWKAFDARYPKFASDPRSVRLGLASDGFNPFRKAPGDDIDIYLILLIKELKLLWNGVDAYYAFSKEQFKLRASPLHRRWLEPNHNYRSQMDRFDGTIETEGSVSVLTGYDILKQLRDDKCSAFGDKDDLIEENIDGEQRLLKKRNIFFDLPYWEYNLLRHSLDVMHIEKNIFDNLLGTLMNWDGKSKDNENSRKDLKEIPPFHSSLHPSSSSSNFTLSQSFRFEPLLSQRVVHEFPSSSQQPSIQNTFKLEDDENEEKVSDVEIIGQHGNILRTEKMTIKDVYKLNEGEKILVHVNCHTPKLGLEGIRVRRRDVIAYITQD
ncbi:RNA-directed DNA polymerase [Tanacetum coccineum]